MTFPHSPMPGPRPGPPPGGFRPGPPPGGPRPVPGSAGFGPRPAQHEPREDTETHGSQASPGYGADDEASAATDGGAAQSREDGAGGAGADGGVPEGGAAGQGVGPSTGHPAVDGVLRSLANTARLAPADQIAGYEAAHQVLQETLASIDG